MKSLDYTQLWGTQQVMVDDIQQIPDVKPAYNTQTFINYV